jgi:hypothetical protein
VGEVDPSSTLEAACPLRCCRLLLELNNPVEAAPVITWLSSSYRPEFNHWLLKASLYDSSTIQPIVYLIPLKGIVDVELVLPREELILY